MWTIYYIVLKFCTFELLMDSFVLKTGNYFGRKFLLFVVVFKVVARMNPRVSQMLKTRSTDVCRQISWQDVKNIRSLDYNL